MPCLRMWLVWAGSQLFPLRALCTLPMELYPVFVRTGFHLISHTAYGNGKKFLNRVNVDERTQRPLYYQTKKTLTKNTTKIHRKSIVKQTLKLVYLTRPDCNDVMRNAYLINFVYVLCALPVICVTTEMQRRRAVLW